MYPGRPISYSSADDATLAAQITLSSHPSLDAQRRVDELASGRAAAARNGILSTGLTRERPRRQGHSGAPDAARLVRGPGATPRSFFERTMVLEGSRHRRGSKLGRGGS